MIQTLPSPSSRPLFLIRGPHAPLALVLIGLLGCGGGGSAGQGSPPAGDPGGDPGGGGTVGFPVEGIDTGDLPSFEGQRVHAWQPLELTFETGATSPLHGGLPAQGDQSPGNPWLDWRLDVLLTRPDGVITQVPGFFAGDGDGGERGSVWRVRFTPPSVPGLWLGTAILRYGENVNVDAPGSGAGTPLWGRTLRVVVLPPDLDAPGFFGRGPVQADGAGRLRHGDRTLFVKAGVGSPENLLGYEGFDGALDGFDGGPPGESGGAPDFLHGFEPHRADWRSGDPDWSGGRGRPIIGAMNYLGSVGANAIYVMPMNLGGDGRDTFPFVSNSGGARFPAHPDDALSYAVQRLGEWDMVLRHAQSLGILVQMVLAEREPTNIDWLGGATSVARRLYQKQLCAHFGYLPGLEWTLCEENASPGAATFAQFTPAELREQALWIRAWDPSQHPRSVHVDPNDLSLYAAMIDAGLASWLDCVSLQVHGDESGNARLYGALAEEVAGRFASVGRRVVVHMDEPGHYLTGVGSELHPDAWVGAPYAGAEDRRRRVLYDSLFSGAGLLWYFGLYGVDEGGGDLTTEDFRTRATVLRETRIARELVERTFAGAALFGPADELWVSDQSPVHPVYGDAEVLAESGGAALVYLPALVGGRLMALRQSGGGALSFTAQWVSPLDGQGYGPVQSFDPTQEFRPEPPPGSVGSVDWVLVVTAGGS